MKSSSEVDNLIESLKVALKTKGVTYKKLAEKLNLSEASVKRMFSRKEMSLHRLGQVCETAGIKLADLVKTADASHGLSHHVYTEEQEQAFVKNPSLLALLNHILNGETPKKIKDQHKLSWNKVRQLLKQLENLGFLEVHPKDKIKLLIPPKVQWRKDGPLQKNLLPLALREFINSNFSSKSELKKFVNIRLSEPSVRRFQTQIDELVTEINRVSRIEQSVSSKLEDIGVLCAIRPWRFSVLTRIG